MGSNSKTLKNPEDEPDHVPVQAGTWEERWGHKYSSEAVSKYLGSGRDPLEKDHLGCSSAKGHAHPVKQLLRRVQVLLLG